ncbi:hypothetical protein DMUE_0639 [Dictyocoela muelleri]|nr:hypothetical protein DMUE_0639 [Dictyocoela muelleri]
MKNLHPYTALFGFISKNKTFRIKKNMLECVVWNKEMIYYPNEGTKTLKRHIKSKQHKINLIESQNQQKVTEICLMQVFNLNFDRKLVKAFSAANIHIFKLHCAALKSFLREYTGKNIHDESHYRKMIPNVYSAKRKLIFSILKDKYIFLMFDETTNSNGKNS